jgi:hypothetical protein
MMRNVHVHGIQLKSVHLAGVIAIYNNTMKTKGTEGTEKEEVMKGIVRLTMTVRTLIPAPNSFKNRAVVRKLVC